MLLPAKDEKKKLCHRLKAIFSILSLCMQTSPANVILLLVFPVHRYMLRAVVCHHHAEHEPPQSKREG